MFVPPYATRSSDVNWHAVLNNALRKVQLRSSTAVDNAVGMLDSYYHQPSSSSSSDVPQVPEDAMQQCSFLLAFDQSVAGWPSTLLLTLQPPPAAVDGHVINVTRPYVEAVLVLYNASIFYLREGVADITRVRAEAVRLAVGAGQSVAPNVNAKKAYKSFTTAQTLAQRADSLTRSAVSGAMLDRTDVAHLTTYVNAHSLLEICRLCSAVAKYVCAASSSATSSKHTVLSGLAYEAAAISLPASVDPSLTVTLLPTVLMAVYHFHKAETYYEKSEIDAAVGHIVFADDLLRQVAARVKKNQKFVQKTWDSILQSVKGKLGGGSSSSDSPLVEFTVEEKDDEEVKESAKLYAEMARHVVKSDLVVLFPFLQSHLSKQLSLFKKCLYENRVLYFARPWPAAKVRVDVPDIADPLTDRTYQPTDADQIASTLFSELPSASQVHERLVTQSKEEQRTRQATERLLEVQRQESEVLLVAELPAAVAQALDDLEPCLRTDSGTIEGALHTAQAAIRSVTDRFLTAARDWQRRHPSAQGVPLDALPTCAAVREAVEEWENRSEQLHATWEREVGTGLTTREQIEAALFPSRSACLSFVDQADQLVYRISQSMEHGEVLDDLERAVAQHLAEGSRCVAAGRAAATTLIDKRLPLLKEIAKLLWDAPAVIEVIGSSQEDLQQMQRELAAVAPTPVAEAHFTEKAKPKSQTTGGTTSTPRQKRSRSSSVDSATLLTPVESLSESSTPRKSAVSPAVGSGQKKKQKPAPAPRGKKSKKEKLLPKVVEEEDQTEEADAEVPAEEEKEEVTTATVSNALLAKIRASRQRAAAAADAAAAAAVAVPQDLEEKEKEEQAPAKKAAPRGKKGKTPAPRAKKGK